MKKETFAPPREDSVIRIQNRKNSNSRFAQKDSPSSRRRKSLVKIVLVHATALGLLSLTACGRFQSAMISDLGKSSNQDTFVASISPTDTPIRNLTGGQTLDGTPLTSSADDQTLQNLKDSIPSNSPENHQLIQNIRHVTLRFFNGDENKINLKQLETIHPQRIQVNIDFFSSIEQTGQRRIVFNIPVTKLYEKNKSDTSANMPMVDVAPPLSNAPYRLSAQCARADCRTIVFALSKYSVQTNHPTKLAKVIANAGFIYRARSATPKVIVPILKNKSDLKAPFLESFSQKLSSQNPELLYESIEVAHGISHFSIDISALGVCLNGLFTSTEHSNQELQTVCPDSSQNPNQDSASARRASLIGNNNKGSLLIRLSENQKWILFQLVVSNDDENREILPTPEILNSTQLSIRGFESLPEASNPSDPLDDLIYIPNSTPVEPIEESTPDSANIDASSPSPKVQNRDSTSGHQNSNADQQMTESELHPSENAEQPRTTNHLESTPSVDANAAEQNFSTGSISRSKEQPSETSSATVPQAGSTEIGYPQDQDLIQLDPNHEISKSWINDIQRPEVELFLGQWIENQSIIDRFKQFYIRLRPNASEVFADLKAQGIPNELAFITLIESRFFIDPDYPIEISGSQAVGPWQFMSKTAQYLGLKVFRLFRKNQKPAAHPCDQRANLHDSTRAASLYFKRLFAQFPHDAKLGILAYNWGPGNVGNAIDDCAKSNACTRSAKEMALMRQRIREIRDSNIDFWTVNEYKMMPKESRDFVFKFLASMRVNQSKDQFDVDTRADRELAQSIERAPHRPSQCH